VRKLATEAGFWYPERILANRIMIVFNDPMEHRHKAGQFGDRQVAGITDQCTKTTGLRRVMSKMPPKIAVAIKPARTCNPFSQCRDDPVLIWCRPRL
jgi:hypothetical protein